VVVAEQIPRFERAMVFGQVGARVPLADLDPIGAYEFVRDLEEATA
jgi:hypothetical protein